MKKGLGSALVLLAVVAIVFGVGWGVLRDTTVLPGGDECRAVVGDHEVVVSVEQAENAALISALSVARGLPARAASIALATSYQESDLLNVEFGDRDSLGLFQQRPSQGWGTAEQVLDPVYATNAFYDALVEVEGYESLEITEAAQEVQRSGYPEAYADHELDARTLASALTGQSQGAFACEVSTEVSTTTAELDDTGLTPRAARIRREVLAVFGEDLALGGFAPQGVDSGHMAGSTHYSGRAVDIFLRPVTEANQTRGWAIASYLVAMSDRLDVQTVIFDDRIWRRGADDSWRDYDVPSSSTGDRSILEHRDHVHVDVFA